MMAAIAASNENTRVTLLEKNEKLGKKIYITGKGRCNFTNGIPIEDFFSNIVSNPKFLYSALYSWTNEDTMDFIASHGTPWKEERGNRIFPVSDHASDVTAALSRALKEKNVKVMLNTEVETVLAHFSADLESTEAEGSNKNRANKKVTGVVLKDGSNMDADAVIIAAGGLSYPSTGSTGDGMRWASELGLNVTDCYPALVSFHTAEKYAQSMEGLSLKNVSLKIYAPEDTRAENKNSKNLTSENPTSENLTSENSTSVDLKSDKKKSGGRKKPLYDEFGEMIFTHFGISGPLVLTASSLLDKKLKKYGTLKAFIDLKPALSEQTLDERLKKIISENINRDFKNFYQGLLPAKMMPVMVELTGIDPAKKLNEITKEERRRILTLLKAMPFTITSTGGYKEAIITQGGVSVKEIDPSTMECKAIKGLYFAGETIDVDALTGGFNLQIAFSTGHLAGVSAGENQ